MARVAKSEANVTGVYRFLERRERDAYEDWELAQERRVTNGYAGECYPRQRRLDAFAAGVPVNVDSGDILGWNAVRDGAPVVPRPVGLRHRARAIVDPDDTITFADENWAALFIEENGL
jgi:hypothetical protein